MLAHTDDPEPVVRAAVLRALGALLAPEAMTLAHQALTVVAVDERVAGIRALGDLRDRASLPAVRPFLDAAEPRERQAAALALGQLAQHGDPASLAILRRLLHDPQAPVQEAARASLELLSDDPAEVSALERRRFEEFILPPDVAMPP